MKIKTKLLLTFIAVAIIGAIIGGIGFFSIESLNKDLIFIKDNRMPAQVALANLNFERMIIRAQNFEAKMAKEHTDLNKVKEILKSVQEARKASWTKVDTNWEIISTIPRTSEREKQLQSELKGQYQAWRSLYIDQDALIEKMLNVTNYQDFLTLLNLFVENFNRIDVASNIMGNSFVEMTENNTTYTIKIIDEAAASAASSEMIIIIVILVGLILSVIAGFFIAGQIQKIIQSVIDQTRKLVDAAVNGKLDIRANEMETNFEFRDITIGINKTLDAVIGPLNVAAEYVDRISKGDIPPKITDNYSGDFNEIKNNLNQCIDAVNNLVADAGMLAKAAVEGKLDTRANASKHQGDFRAIVQGVNDTLDNVIGPLNVAAEYVDRISKGDIPPKITDNYSGDFNEIKNNLNQCIDAVNNLVADAGMLAKAAVEGKLDTRANASKHQGDFRKIVEGVNKTLDLVIEPVNEAGEVLGVMATGDLTVRMLGSYKGDLSKLKSDINSLADSLCGLITQVNEVVQTSASSATEISATAEGLAAATQEQSSQADEVASAVEQMSRTITENAMSANKTAEMAQMNGNIATEGGQVVSQTVNKMRDIAGVVKNSAENIEKLGESSKQIGEIISVIDDIADQTNLLALNAAIEAARAGEQGRGFAVVADEVRKLAERTTEATKQIANMIKGIQSETEQAVIAMNKGNVEVRSGIELADKAGNSLQSILTSTREVRDMINQIAAASEEQSATSEQISKNVMSISKVTSESARRVEDVAHTSDELAKMTDKLADLMSQFRVDNSSEFAGSSMKQIGRRQGKHLTAGK